MLRGKNWNVFPRCTIDGVISRDEHGAIFIQMIHTWVWNVTSLGCRVALAITDVTWVKVCKLPTCISDTLLTTESLICENKWNGSFKILLFPFHGVLDFSFSFLQVTDLYSFTNYLSSFQKKILALYNLLLYYCLSEISLPSDSTWTSKNIMWMMFIVISIFQG